MNSLTGIGSFSEMHHFCRYICMIGCIIEICFDSISCIQVYSYYQSILSNSAPLVGSYSNQSYQFYIWRDIVSIGLCFLITLFLTYLFTLLGWGSQHVPFWQIAGGHLDRETVMRNNLTNRLHKTSTSRQPLLETKKSRTKKN